MKPPSEIVACPLRIVTINSHQSYLHLLSGLPHQFLVVDQGLKGSGCRWFENVRPLPERFRKASLTEATIAARRSPFDLSIAHNMTDLLAMRDLCERRVLLLHGSLDGRIVQQRSRTRAEDFLLVMRRYLENVPADVVCISASKAHSWRDLCTRIIDHGIPTEWYHGYTGEIPAVLRVANLQRERGAVLNHDLQQEVVRGIPNRLYGWNPGLPDSSLASDWEGLKRAYRTHRCFLITNREPFEDGYNLATLEAMATGMPVVTTDHPTSPIRHGENGLVGRTATELREHVSRLLHDRDLAMRLGNEARRTVSEQFSYVEFLSRWESTLQRAAGREASPDAVHLKVIQGGKQLSPRSPRDASVTPDTVHVVSAPRSAPAPETLGTVIEDKERPS